MTRAVFRVIVACGVLLSSACATPDVVSVRQIGDDKLNCGQIKEQFADAQEFEKKARREKGATGTNVAAALFFWPALLATYSNIEEATTAAKDRQMHLEKIAKKMGCSL